VKILFFNTSNGVYEYAVGDSHAVGGAERQQWLLARALVGAGWSVTVGLQGVPDLDDGTTISRVHFVNISGQQTLSSPAQRLLSLYRFLRFERPDWFYWRTASHLLGPAVTFCKHLGVKTIFAAAFDTDVYPRHALAVRQRWWPLYAWGLFNTDRIFVQYSGQLFELSPRLRVRAAIVPNMIHMPSTMIPHLERERYVAWVGMLRQHKRPDLLLEIAQKSPHLRFVVCGGPSEHRSSSGYGAQIRDRLKAIPNIDYRGQVAPDNAYEIIANASALLCTSEGEGFPNVFLEAWASGTPVVSLRIDPDHIIKRFRLGAVSVHVDSAVAHLEALMNSPSQRQAIGVRATHYVREAHSGTAVINAFQQAIRKERNKPIMQQTHVTAEER